jgi:hypothetical protein
MGSMDSFGSFVFQDGIVGENCHAMALFDPRYTKGNRNPVTLCPGVEP